MQQFYTNHWSGNIQNWKTVIRLLEAFKKDKINNLNDYLDDKWHPEKWVIVITYNDHMVKPLH